MGETSDPCGGAPFTVRTGPLRPTASGDRLVCSSHRSRLVSNASGWSSDRQISTTSLLIVRAAERWSTLLLSGREDFCGRIARHPAGSNFLLIATPSHLPAQRITVGPVSHISSVGQHPLQPPPSDHGGAGRGWLARCRHYLGATDAFLLRKVNDDRWSRKPMSKLLICCVKVYTLPVRFCISGWSTACVQRASKSSRASVTRPSG